MSRAERWATSALALFVVTFGIYQLNVVDETGNDPALAPWTALSIVRSGDVTLDDVPLEFLVDRPVVISGGEDPGVGAGHVFEDRQTLVRALGSAGPEAHVYDYFPLTGALLAVPAVGFLDAAEAVVGTPDARELLIQDRFAPYHLASASLVVALAVLAARATALEVLTGTERRRRWVATAVGLVVAFGTTAWSVASRALWQHGPSLLFGFLALWLVLRIDPAGPESEAGPSSRDVQRSAVLGVVLTLAVLARPTNAALAAALLVFLAVRKRRLLIPAVLAAGATSGVAAIVLWALGAPLPPPYYGAGRVGLHDGFAEALAANWVSPNRGLLWSTPVVVLALPGAIWWWRDRDRRPLVVALGSAVVLVWLSVSGFPQWWAGHTFGARFMTESLPPLAVLCLPAVDRLVLGGHLSAAWMATRARARATGALLAVLCVWSVGVHALGTGTRQVSCWNTDPVDIDQDPSRVWSVTDGQVTRTLRTAADGDLRRAVLGPC